MTPSVHLAYSVQQALSLVKTALSACPTPGFVTKSLIARMARMKRAAMLRKMRCWFAKWVASPAVLDSVMVKGVV